jgi:hypothetical protein
MTATQAAPQHSPLMELILRLLTPLFMAGGITDIILARRAAAAAIDACKASTGRDLISIAQIIAFSLIALDNLRLATRSDLPLSIKLKLQANANALSRCCRDATQRFDEQRRNVPPLCGAWTARPDEPVSAEPLSLPEPATSTETQPAVPAPAMDPAPRPPQTRDAAPPPRLEPVRTAPLMTPEHRNRLQWANAMQAEAERLRAEAASASPEQQKTNQMWHDALTAVAADLRAGNYPKATPGMSRAELMRTTLLAGGDEFPSHLTRRGKRSTGKR